MGILGLIAVLIQSSFLPGLSFLPVRPELPLLIIISYALIEGLPGCLFVAFFTGLFLDILSSTPFGLNALTFLIFSFILALVRGHGFRSELILPISLTPLISFFYYLFWVILTRISGLQVPWGGDFFRFAFPVAVLNTLMIPLIFITLASLCRLFRFWQKKEGYTHET